MNIASLTIDVQGDFAIVMHGNLPGPEQIKATAYYALAFAPVAVVMGFAEAGCDYLIAQRAPVAAVTGEDSDGNLTLSFRQTSKLDLESALQALHESEDRERWEIDGDMLTGRGSEIMLTSLLRLLDLSTVTA